ncbi:MAG: hypothetical protein CM1200mP18_16750 [Gammaproteobacteria bacterium]|nr:MAG: hypothetical protein CM1200mP18_16750 [Gammaproteobacteria bacterium]
MGFTASCRAQNRLESLLAFVDAESTSAVIFEDVQVVSKLLRIVCYCRESSGFHSIDTSYTRWHLFFSLPHNLIT